MKVEVAVLNKSVREVLAAKVTLRQRLKGNDDLSQWCLGKSIPDTLSKKL